MTYDTQHSYTFDADGNILTVDNGQTATYVYDALNHRVSATVGSNTTEFVFNGVPDDRSSSAGQNANGERVSEWNAANHTQLKGKFYWGTTPLAYYDATTHFEHQDWLGTERMRTSATGNVEAKFTSLPWGDMQGTQTGSDTDATHYATLDYDSETNTGHAQFRQYKPTQGRFLSPDPYGGSYNAGNPQSMNRYVYAMDNPLSNIDPSGQDACDDYGESQDFCVAVDGGGGGDLSLWESSQQDYVPGSIEGSPTGGGGSGGNGPSFAPRIGSLLQCASKLANKYSLAGAFGLTEGDGVGSTIGTAFLGNTFSGMVDAGTHIYQNIAGGGNGNQVVGDWVLGGARQGLPGGGVFSKGVVGVTTEAALGTTAESIVSPVTGEVTSLAAEGTLGAEGAAGPVGLIKLGIDGAIFAGAALACASN